MKYINTDTGVYRSEDAVRAEYAARDFSPPFFPYPPDVRVQETARPSCDALTQDVVEADPALVDGVWTQQWSVVDVSAQEAARRFKATVPHAVTMRQARLALFGTLAQDGATMLSKVAAAIASLPSPQKEAAQIEWEYSGEVQREKALVLALAPALGLSDAQLDSLFIAAAKL